ncbi:hypothetical protein K435DRAFT_874483 [Dendrothele bispora CBS 962.96]|uniref:DUF659 domain-containing protein n=1 Tax=Dendrothele bispora (strain CBS 962.96) TaxID=1314807 RepID=A0A4S8KWI9_DENBC|nr:hypothetical protein K435DRAFT_874483 [Dendrothele bispora CBS 962.96]
MFDFDPDPNLVPNILDTDEWKEFMSIANPKYKVTSSSSFADNHMPKEAARIHKEMTFLFCGYEGTVEKHNAEWVKNHILRAIDEVGREHIGCLCSDSTGNVKNGKALAKLELPTVLTLPDCCHHIALTIKDITNLEEFKPMIKTLKATIQHFGHSDSATKKLEHVRKEENVTEGLVTVGKTRFATHYTAAVALDRCFPFIQDLLNDGSIQIKDKDVVATFTGRMRATEFQLALAQYIRIIGPLARSLWALEASQTNAAHVFLFWLAMDAELKDLFALDISKTEIDCELAQKITRIFNSHYKEFIEQSPDDPYFTTFFLDPCYVRSNILKSSSPSTIPEPIIRLSAQVTTLSNTDADQTPNPKAYCRVKTALKNILRCEVELYQRNPSTASIAPLMKLVGNAKALAEEFDTQLVACSRGEYPFSDPLGSKSVLEWWQELSLHPKGRALAFLGVKIVPVRGRMTDLEIEVDSDIDLDSSGLKAVLPKEIYGLSPILAGLTEEAHEAVGTSLNGPMNVRDVDWDKV